MSKRTDRIAAAKARPRSDTNRIRDAERARVGSIARRFHDSSAGQIRREILSLADRRAGAQSLSGRVRKRRRLTDGDFRRKATRLERRSAERTVPQVRRSVKPYPDKARIAKEQKRGGTRHEHGYGEQMFNHQGLPFQKCECGAMRFL